MQAKPDLVSSLAVLALIVVGFWLTTTIDLSFTSDLETFSGPRAYPRLLLSLALVFNLIIIGRAWLGLRAGGAGHQAEAPLVSGRLKAVAAAVALGLFVLLLEPVGYILTMLPLLVVLSLLFGARRPAVVVGVSLALMLVCLIAFRFGLNTVLPEGAFGIDMLV